MGGKRKRGGAVGEFPPEGLERRHPIVEGRMYRLSPLSSGLAAFEPTGWMSSALGALAADFAERRIEPNDTFLAVERESGPSDEVWLVLCKGTLSRVLLSEWALREVLEVSE